jgi:hypothetical protein
MCWALASKRNKLIKTNLYIWIVIRFSEQERVGRSWGRDSDPCSLSPFFLLCCLLEPPLSLVNLSPIYFYGCVLFSWWIVHVLGYGCLFGIAVVLALFCCLVLEPLPILSLGTLVLTGTSDVRLPAPPSSHCYINLCLTYAGVFLWFMVLCWFFIPDNYLILHWSSSLLL